MKRFLFIISAISLLFLCVDVIAQTSNTALVITLHPQEINDLGAGWRIKGSGSEWYPSGKTLILSAGSYTVEFKGEISGWMAPADLNITLMQGKTSEYAGIYTRLKGSLKVTIYPQEVVNDGAQWRREGQETWRDNGEVEVDVPIGEYQIEFKKVSGWNVPKKTVISLQPDIINSVSGTYTREQGYLTVTITPQEVVEAGAMWKIQGEDTYWASGVTVIRDIGTYTVEFKPIANWVTPEPIQVKIITNEKSAIGVEYKPATSQEGEGTVEGEGEGEGEKPFPFLCSCEQKKGFHGLKQLLGNFLVFGMSFVLLGFWMGVSRSKKD